MTARLAYLGPEGSFTHETARLVAEQDGWLYAELVPLESVAAVVEAVARGDAGGGVVPIATSLRGPLEREVAAIARAPVREVARVERTCEYRLLAIDGTSIEEVTTILSHPEAFADCAAHLMRLVPQATWVQTPSTGAAALRVAAEASRAVAAIAPATAAEVYGLTSLASDLEDDPDNRTTWAVLVPDEVSR